MNIEPYVVSLELAKQLKEAGYPQRKGLFYWCKQNPYYPDEKPIWLLYSYPISYRKKKPLRGSDYDTSNNPLYHEILAAPTSDELLDKLPEKYDMCFGVEGYIYLCGKRKKYIFDKETNRPDAIAELWLRAKKDGFL